MTIFQIYDAYEYDRSSYCSEATLVKYRDDMLLFFRFLQEKYQVSADTDGFDALPGDASIFRDYIVHMRAGSMKHSTIRSYCRSVKAFLRYCYENDLCPDYLKNVKLPKDGRCSSFWNLSLFPGQMSHRYATPHPYTKASSELHHLLLDCGLRRQEVVNLRPEHIIAERNIISIVDSKGNKSRYVLVPDFLLEAISRYRSMRMFSTGYLLESLRKPGKITDSTVKQMFESLKEESGINRLHPHLLRHTFATSYLMGGGNLEFLRVFLGHYDYTVTKVYSSMAAQLKMLGADIYRLDSIFFTRGY